MLQRRDSQIHDQAVHFDLPPAAMAFRNIGFSYCLFIIEPQAQRTFSAQASAEA